jgi:hypothetical protein
METDTACKYIDTVDLGYRKETRVNAGRFAKDLAEALGGAFDADRFEGDHDKAYRGTFTLDGNRIHVSRSWNNPGKVALSIDIDVAWHAVGSMPYVSEYRPEMKLKDISVSVERPMDTIVKDVRKRLIAANFEALQLRREFYDTQVRAQSAAGHAKQDLAKRFGNLLTLRLDEKAESGSFEVRGHYCHGRFSADGSITIDRLGSVTAEQFAAILKAIAPKD